MTQHSLPTAAHHPATQIQKSMRAASGLHSGRTDLRWGARQGLHTASWLLGVAVLAMGWPCCAVGAEHETAASGWTNARDRGSFRMNRGAHPASYVPSRSPVLYPLAVLQLRGGGKHRPDAAPGGEDTQPGLDVAYCATVSVAQGLVGWGFSRLCS